MNGLVYVTACRLIGSKPLPIWRVNSHFEFQVQSSVKWFRKSVFENVVLKVRYCVEIPMGKRIWRKTINNFLAENSSISLMEFASVYQILTSMGALNILSFMLTNSAINKIISSAHHIWVSFAGLLSNLDIPVILPPGLHLNACVWNPWPAFVRS